MTFSFRCVGLEGKTNVAVVTNRRTFIGGAALVCAGIPLLASCSSILGEKRELPIPPLAPFEMDGDVKVFTLHAQSGVTEHVPGKQTPTWGFEGPYLGPTVRVREGETVRINIVNGLDVMTTIHWHGMQVPPECDGGPHQPIEPGETWSPQWTISQQAAMVWYHPHPHGLTGLHAYRGLAGPLIIDDDNSDGLDLPRDYGVDDIPLALTDVRLNSDGTRDEMDLPDLGLLGDISLANGINNAVFHATTRRVRLRVLDGSTMRMYNLAFKDGRTFYQIGSDSGLLNNPIALNRIVLSPGERADIIVDLEPGETVVLQDQKFPDDLGLPNRPTTPDFGIDDKFDVLTMVGPPEDANLPEPGPLPDNMNPSADEFPDLTGAPERYFALKGFRINDEVMDMQRVDFAVDHPGWEVWNFDNNDIDWLHNMHVHDCAFRIISLRNANSQVMVDGWKDTVLLPPGAIAKVAVRFNPEFHSTRWPYMLHCHMLYHEDMGMMSQFMVVQPGEVPDEVIGDGVEGSSELNARTGISDYSGHGH